MMPWTAATAVRRTLVACAWGEFGATSPTGLPHAWVAQPSPSTTNPKTASSRDIALDPTPRTNDSAHLHESDGPSHRVDIGSLRYTIANDFTSPRCRRTHSVPFGV